MRLRVFSLILLAASLPLNARAVEPKGGAIDALNAAPKIKAPEFPLEPNKRPARPVDPKTYVEAPDEPPPPESDRAIAREGKEPGTWWNTLELGWFYGSYSAKHSFISTGSQTVRQITASPLSLMANLELWPPNFFISLVTQVAGTFGHGEATAPESSLGRIEFNSQDLRAKAGIRIHPFKRSVDYDIRLGLDVEAGYRTFATLTPAQTTLDIDNRLLLLAIPRLELRYSKNPNWQAQLGGGYAAAIQASGAGNVVGQPYRRIDLDATALRYLTPGNAVGVGVFYNSEKVTWAQTVPSTLTDEMTSTDFRLNLFWRRDF